MSGRKDTNSNNPNLVKSRVFVGNLNHDNCTQEEMEKTFSKHGKISGCSIHKNFGFVQFEEVGSAKEMVAEWHGKTFAGKRIDCNIADERRKPQQKDDNRARSPPPPRRRAPSPRHDRMRSRSPRRDRDRPPHGMYGRRDERPSRFSDRDDRDYDSPSARYPINDGGNMGYDRPRDYYDRDHRDGGDFDYRRDYASTGYPDTSYDTSATSLRRPAIDCEVIVLNKEQRQYAEMVEGRLRRIGVVANVVFPRPEVRVVDMIERVARSGSLYCIVLSAQNEMHSSCTLNIMYGQRQEHRNMPLEDALAFVAKHFDQFLRDSNGSSQSQSFTYPTRDYAAPSTTAAPVSTQQTNPEMAELLVAAAAGKTLDDAQIAKLATELKKRNAGNTQSPMPPQQPPVQEKQADLQSLVLKILGHPKDDGVNNSQQQDTNQLNISGVGSSSGQYGNNSFNSPTQNTPNQGYGATSSSYGNNQSSTSYFQYGGGSNQYQGGNSGNGYGY